MPDEEQKIDPDFERGEVSLRIDEVKLLADKVSADMQEERALQLHFEMKRDRQKRMTDEAEAAMVDKAVEDMEYTLLHPIEPHGRRLETLPLKRFSLVDYEEAMALKDPLKVSKCFVQKMTGVAANEMTFDAVDYRILDLIAQRFL